MLDVIQDASTLLTKGSDTHWVANS